MNKETFDYVAERADALADSEFSTQVTKDAAQAWRDAVAADSSDAAIDAATNDLLDVLEGRPTTIDGVIAFLQGPAIEMLGEDAAASALAAASSPSISIAGPCRKAITPSIVVGRPSRTSSRSFVAASIAASLESAATASLHACAASFVTCVLNSESASASARSAT